MDFELKTLDLAAAASEKCDALVLLVTDGFQGGKDALSRLAADALKARDLEAKPGKLLQAWRPTGIAAGRLLLAGAGDGSGKRIHAAVQAAVSALRTSGVRRLLICLPEAAEDDAVRAAVAATAEASYVYVTTKSKPEGRELQRVVLAVADAPARREAFAAAKAAALGIEFARELANLPPNHATPTRLGEEAKKLAKLGGFQCEVLGPKEVTRLGMGALLGVAQGSQEPLRFIVLKYQGAAAADAPVVLVGKGITFDSGGISIKPAAEMDEMKFDMGGAASVLGTFRALAELRPRLNVVGLIPSCENMPGGRAFKPGDVLQSLSGQTIEVLNTDAEGRLILCDALTYAERFKPRAVVDVATLTGACVIALGGVRTGLFATDDGLAQALQSAGDAALDPCWRLPLDDEYGEGLKSNFADMANVAGRPGGAITAAKFLQRFTAKYPWAHLDIAGTAWKGGAAKGSTGRPVGLLVQYLLSQQAAGSAAAKAVRRKAVRAA
ncbi:leucyl aminopeptidase [Ramlibacter tataouinensis]|uniref:Probable cytosol aminopeptidase n=1 Tax=Ramlibacter tataouinensis (strain ATCC BAA-407 / DSM 14655 / LMG 21543 / TTB310) TaxID=365046 RepID=F5XX90_RAMTT|nr:leucyl aminopeptidase [Ramlibacter tataouinensis]AEG93034.1 Leucyl aminopeptidase [Ramlibacter tataouinensis TTB310]